MAGQAFIGTSGWNYKGWSNGVFYPPELKPAAWLDFYARHLDTVEVNNTFYNLPAKRVFEAWRDQTPDHFRFAIKASRFITHMKKLLDPAEHVTLFLERAAGLEHKLSVILFQLPPFWRYNGARLETFCQFVARQDIVPGVRVALEVRNVSWLGEGCFDTLRKHNVALAFADWPSAKVQGPLTADFVFVRRHGPTGLYCSDYDDAQLQGEADRINAWRAEGKDVYAYFNNDACAFAVKNALTLQQMLKTHPRHRGARAECAR